MIKSIITGYLIIIITNQYIKYNITENVIPDLLLNGFYKFNLNLSLNFKFDRKIEEKSIKKN